MIYLQYIKSSKRTPKLFGSLKLNLPARTHAIFLWGYDQPIFLQFN